MDLTGKLYIGTVTEAAFQVASEYGIGLELDEFCSADNMEEPRLTELEIQLAEEVKGKALIFHAPFNELFPAAIDSKALALAYARYEQAYGLACRFGAKKMVVHSGYVPHVYFKEWHRERSVEFWTRFMADKPEDFMLCIENVLEDEPYMMAELLREIRNARGQSAPDQIRLCLDLGHANCISSVDILEWVNVMGPYMGHVHLHNNNGQWDYHQSLEEGTIHMEAALCALAENCPQDTTYTLETRPCRQSVEWLIQKGFLGGAYEKL